MGFNDNRLVVNKIDPELKGDFVFQCTAHGVTVSSRIRAHAQRDAYGNWEELADPEPNAKERKS
jgi:hypothetical protein